MIDVAQWQGLLAELPILCQPIFDQANQQVKSVTRKQDGSLLTETDMALQQAVSGLLLKFFPQIPILGEEMEEVDQQVVLDSGSCWLLDPLDGTSNFSHGIPVYSVSAALLWQGQVIAGLVFDPNRQELFHARLADGAYLNEQLLDRRMDTTPNQLKHAMAVIDTKRLSSTLAVAVMTQHPYHSQRSFGSVALDWCWLAAGRIQTYLHGKQKLWDFSAGALIAQEAGCLTSTLEGHSILAAPITLTARSALGAVPPLVEAWPAWVTDHAR